MKIQALQLTYSPQTHVCLIMTLLFSETLHLLTLLTLQTHNLPGLPMLSAVQNTGIQVLFASIEEKNFLPDPSKIQCCFSEQFRNQGSELALPWWKFVSILSSISRC